MATANRAALRKRPAGCGCRSDKTYIGRSFGSTPSSLHADRGWACHLNRVKAAAPLSDAPATDLEKVGPNAPVLQPRIERGRRTQVVVVCELAHLERAVALRCRSHRDKNA